MGSPSNPNLAVSVVVLIHCGISGYFWDYPAIPVLRCLPESVYFVRVEVRAEIEKNSGTTDQSSECKEGADAHDPRHVCRRGRALLADLGRQEQRQAMGLHLPSAWRLETVRDGARRRKRGLQKARQKAAEIRALLADERGPLATKNSDKQVPTSGELDGLSGARKNRKGLGRSQGPRLPLW